MATAIELTPDELKPPAAAVPTGSGQALPLELTPAEIRRREDEAATGTFKGWGADLLRSARTGARSGPEGIAAFPGDLHSLLYDLQSAATTKLMQWAGSDPAKIKAVEDELKSGKWNFLPTTPKVEEKTSEYVGENYRPKSATGRMVKTAASMVTGGAPRAIIRDVIAPAVGIEYGGQIGEAVAGDKGKIAGEIVGGIGVPAAKELAMQRLVPTVEPERADRIRTLTREGIELTGGQATGSKALQYLETGPFEGKPAAIARDQSQQFTRAALQRAGLNADRADPDAMRAWQDTFSREYEDLINQANGVTMDPPLAQALTDIGARFERLKGTGPGVPTAVNHYFDRIIDASAQNGGVIPPDVFRTLRKDIAADIAGTSDIETSQALREFQDSLFDSVGRASADPTTATRARELNNRYRNFKIIEESVGGAGEGVSFGYVSPAKLRAAVEKRDPSAYRQGRGDFAGLARAGQSITDLPQSGTAGRAAPFAGVSAVTAGVSQLLHGDTLGGLATLGGTAGAFAAPGIATMRPVRTSLVRRAQGDHPDFFEPMQLMPLMQSSGASDEPLPIEEEAAPQKQSMMQEPAPVDGDPRMWLRPGERIGRV